jgi:acyl-coenzyme A thioesterase PaaI-like protein
MFEDGREPRMIQLPSPPVGRLLGFAMKSIEPGHATFEMEVDEPQLWLRAKPSRLSS